MDDTETTTDPGKAIPEGCGLTFIATSNTFGNGKAGERRLCLDRIQGHQASTQVAKVKRVTFFAKTALAVHFRYQDLHPKTIHYQRKVADMFMTDESTATENPYYSVLTPHAMRNIINRCRIACRNFIRRGGDPYSPAPVIRENETQSDFLAREHLECALTGRCGLFSNIFMSWRLSRERRT